MSLQGSFETIALPDVMTLLAASNKSGELRVVGGQLDGRLWLHEGRLVGSKVGKAHGHVDAIFELLRLTEGNFVFKDGVEAPAPGEETVVGVAVGEAEERLKEWQDIIRVVPSVDHRVRLIPDLPTDEVTLSAEEWHLVMAIAVAGTVQGVLEELALGQFEGSRGIRRLVDVGLAVIDPPRVRPATPRPARRVAPISSTGALAPPTRPAPEAAPAYLPAPSPNGHAALIEAASSSLPFDLGDFEGDEDEDLSAEPVAIHPISVVGEHARPAPIPRPDDADQLRGRRARRMAANRDLSPQPVAAADPPAARAQSPAGSPSPSDVESEGDHINRGLLLKFLSSVKS